MRELIHELRASMVVAVYRLSCRFTMLALTPDVFRTILEDSWADEPPRQYAAEEAEAFIAYLRAKNLRLPQLTKVLEFEKAAMDTVLDGTPRVVKFSCDPFPLLRALAKDGCRMESRERVPMRSNSSLMDRFTLTGIDLEQLHGVFPFHQNHLRIPRSQRISVYLSSQVLSSLRGNYFLGRRLLFPAKGKIRDFEKLVLMYEASSALKRTW
jgi:hypothetical protein